MHVAVNALFLEPPMGGVETYVRRLCGALLALPDAPRLTVFANPAGHAALLEEDWSGAAELVACPRAGRHGVRALAELTAVAALADRRRADVIHSVAQTGPVVSRAARVVTIHDTFWITHPEDTWTHRMWRAVVPRVAARSARVLTVSAAAAEDIVRELGTASDRVDVVEHGYAPARVRPADPADVRARLGLGDGPVVLNVGQKKPHRNLERLIDAFARVVAEVPDAQLVLPGPPNPAAERALTERAHARGVKIVLPGFVDAADIEALYGLAGAFVLPSLAEGFGIPALEALAHGVPVACSADTAPAEVVGDAGLLFDPLDVKAIADATLALLRDPALAERLRGAGPPRAAHYTWERCARMTLASYRKAR